MRSKPSTKEKRFLNYFDELAPVEHELATIANLCLGVTELEQVDAAVLSDVGSAILRFLDQKRIVDNHFLDRPILLRTLDDATVKGMRLTLKIRAKRND